MCCVVFGLGTGAFLAEFKKFVFCCVGFETRFCGRVVLEETFLFAFGSEEEEGFFVCLCSVGRVCLRSVRGKFVTGFGEGAMLCGCGVVSVARGPVRCVGFGGAGVWCAGCGRRLVALGSGTGGFPAKVLLASVGFVV